MDDRDAVLKKVHNADVNSHTLTMFGYASLLTDISVTVSAADQDFSFLPPSQAAIVRRSVLVVRHGERVDQVFGKSWLQQCSTPDGRSGPGGLCAQTHGHASNREPFPRVRAGLPSEPLCRVTPCRWCTRTDTATPLPVGAPRKHPRAHALCEGLRSGVLQEMEGRVPQEASLQARYRASPPTPAAGAVSE